MLTKELAIKDQLECHKVIIVFNTQQERKQII